MNWLKSHWKKIVGAVFGAVSVYKPELAPLGVIGGILAGSDFQHGAAIGTPIGAAAKELAERAKEITADIKSGLK